MCSLTRCQLLREIKTSDKHCESDQAKTTNKKRTQGTQRPRSSPWEIQMSYCHIKVKKIKQDLNKIEYKIISPDFNDKFEWEEFGILEIDLEKKIYIHKDNFLWEKNKIYPINFFDLTVNQRRDLAEKEYKTHSGGKWAMTLFEFVKEVIATGIFPVERDFVS